MIKRVDDNKEQWNEFVSDKGKVFHSWEWKKVLENTWGYKPEYTTYEKDGKIVACFPLFIVNSPFLGKRAMSLPTSDFGGPLGNKVGCDKLIDDQLNRCKENGVKFLEIKGYKPVKNFQLGNSYINFILRLSDGFENIWKKSFDRKNRNQIRKAERSGVEVKEGYEDKDINNFYQIYLTNMKILGTPPHPLKFYQNMKNEFKDDFKLFISYHEGREISAGVFLNFSGSLYYWAGVSIYDFRNLNPQNLLLSRIIEWGCKNEIKKIEFGRTSRKGVYNFKKSFGGVESEFIYQYKYFNKKSKIDKQGGKNRFSEIWKKYVPNIIAEKLGPIIRKNAGY